MTRGPQGKLPGGRFVFRARGCGSVGLAGSRRGRRGESKMKATYKTVVDLRSFVPEQNRAAWLEKYGVPPATGSALVLTVSLDVWERAGGDIEADGSIRSGLGPELIANYQNKGWSSGMIWSALRDELRRIYARDGQIPDALDLDAVLTQAITARDDAEQARQAKERRLEAERAAFQKQREEAEAAGVAALRTWAEKHGSELLRARMAGGYNWKFLAREEFAQMHQPVGFAPNPEARHMPRENPTLSEIRALHSANALVRDPITRAELVWVTPPCADDEFEEHYAAVRLVIRTPDGECVYVEKCVGSTDVA